MNDPVALVQKALALQQSGQLEEAVAIYRQLQAAYPDHPQLQYLLGAAELRRGNLEAGVALLRKCVKAMPGEAGFWCDLGIGLEQLGRPGEALDCFDRATALQPHNPAAHNNRANTLLLLNRPAEALASIDRALSLEPRAAQAHVKRGVALMRLNRPQDGLAAFEQAIALDASLAAAHFGRGDALGVLERWTEALAGFERALALAPDFSDALVGRAGALNALKRSAEALDGLDRVLAADPDFAVAHERRGAALRTLGRPDEANAAYDRAIELDPQNVDAHLNKAHLLMQMGRLAEAWEHYEWRWKKPHFKELAESFGKPRWRRDQPIAGKRVLVWAEQGLGDTIQFCRFIPQLEGAILEVQPALLGLIRTLKVKAEVIAAGQPRPPFDLHCPLLSLPYMLRTDTIPADVPYLFADPQKATLGPKQRPRIGLSWSGQAFNPAESERRVPLRLLEPLLNLPFDFFVLQKDIRQDDEAALSPRLTLHREALMDFAATAALACQMDLVIAVDGSIAHLAGALGIPLWILLGRNADVRWITGVNPWYPAAQLFRRTEETSWEDVIADVVARLQSADAFRPV